MHIMGHQLTIWQGVFSDWKNQNIDAEKGKWFKSKFGEAPGFTDAKYRERLVKVYANS